VMDEVLKQIRRVEKGKRSTVYPRGQMTPS